MHSPKCTQYIALDTINKAMLYNKKILTSYLNLLAQEVPQSSPSLKLELINDNIDQSLNGGALKAI